MFYGVINETYNKTDYLEMELENSLLFFKSLNIVQESGIVLQEGALGTIVEKVKELWSKFKEWVKGIFEKIKNFFGKFKKKSESKTEEKIIQSLQNPQVAPKSSGGGVSDEEAEKAAKKIKDNWDKIEKLEKENDKEFDNLQDTKKNVANSISERHKEAEEIIKDALKNIYEPLEPIDNGTSNSKDNSTAAETNVLKAQREIEKQLDNLLKDEKEEVSVEDIKEIIKKNAPSPASSNNSKIFYIEDKGYDDNWKNTEYMDFSEGCKKIVQKREFNISKFPYYYHEGRTNIIGSQQAFNAEDTVKIDKEVEDFFTKSFGAFYNASDDEIVIKQKPKESDVQKFARNLGDILVMTDGCASDTFSLAMGLHRDIDRYQSLLDKFTKNAAIVSKEEFRKAEDRYYDNLSDKSIPDPSETMLVRGNNSKFDPSSVAKFIAKDINNMKKYISLLYKINFNCVKVYNYDINFAKAKMFSNQIRRLHLVSDKLDVADFRPKE